MQTCMTVSSDRSRIRVVQNFFETEVPWESKTYAEDFRIARSVGGFFDLSYYGVVGIQGPHAADFLQRLSTADIRKLDAQVLMPASFLNGRSHAISWGWIARYGEDGFLYWTEPQTLSATLAYLDRMHFVEQLTLRDVSEEYALFGVLKAALPDRIAAIPHPRMPGLQICATDRTAGQEYTELWKHGDLALLGQHLFEYDRVQSSIPRLGTEVSDQALALEGGLGWTIAENKGCYPGQEVVERIRSYGRVNRSLTAVRVEGIAAATATLPVTIEASGRTAAQLVSLVDPPLADQATWGLAYVYRQFADRDQPFELPNGARVWVGQHDLR